MTTTLPTVLISGASEELTSRIEQLIRSQAELSLIKSVSPDEAANETFKAKLVWVELESDPEGNVALLEILIKSHPNTFFVVSKEDLEPDLVKKAMQVGALDFLDHKGWAAQIRSVVRRIMAKEFGSKPAPAGGSMNTQRQQPSSRQGSWGQLNSLKVNPSSSGFRRVEPNRPNSAQPAQPAQPAKPAQTAQPVKPAQPAPQAQPVKPALQPAVPEVEEEVVVVIEEEVEAEVAIDDTGEIEQVEQEQEQEEQPYDYGTPEYAYADGEQAEGESEYQADEEVNAEQPYAEEGEGIPEQAQDESIQEEEVAYAEETGEAQLEMDPESYSEDEQKEEAEGIQALQEDTTGGTAEEEESAAEPAKPAPKGRWDELDSIISKETPKTEEKKPPSKWGDLASIQTPKAVQKELSVPQSQDKKWADLDAISAPKSPAAPSSLEKEIPAPTGNKWGDLDNIGSAKSAPKEAPAASSANKWGDLDNIGAMPASNVPQAASKDLDAIGTPEAGGNKWGDLDALGTPKAKAADPAPAEGGNKWGNLDALGAKGGAPKSNTRSFIKPKSPDEGGAAKPKWADADKSSQPAAGAEPATAPKWGNLDKIQTPQADSDSPSSFKNRFGKKTQQFDGPASPDASAGAGGKWGDLDALAAAPATEKKWGADLNAIPTPKAAEPNAAWTELDSIPTPKPEGADAAPGLVAGALPVAQARNEASEKWKSGMSTDLSTGARQMVEMRDKLKGKKFSLPKIGWNNVNVLLAVAIVASVGYLSVQFFSFPEPPAQQSADK